MLLSFVGTGGGGGVYNKILTLASFHRLLLIIL